MTLEERLAEARDAYHRLMTGTLAVKVVIEGQETEFNRVSAGALKAYVTSLEAQLAAGGAYQAGGAIGFIF